MKHIRTIYTSAEIEALYEATKDKVKVICGNSACLMFRTPDGLGYITERVTNEGDIVRDLGNMTFDTLTAFLGAAMTWEEIDCRRIDEIIVSEAHRLKPVEVET